MVHIRVSRVTELLRHTHHKSYSCNGAKHRSTTLKQHNLQQRRRWYISVFSRVTELLLQCCKAQVKTQCCKADGAYLPTATTPITRTAPSPHYHCPRHIQSRITTYNLAPQQNIIPCTGGGNCESNCGSGKSAVAATMASTAASATAAIAQPANSNNIMTV